MIYAKFLKMFKIVTFGCVVFVNWTVLLFLAKMYHIRKILSNVPTSKEFHNNNFFGHNYVIKLIN